MYRSWRNSPMRDQAMRFFDEMHSADAAVRDHYQVYERWLARQAGAQMRARREEAEMIFRRVGITFAVYGDKDEDGSGTEGLIPFDLIPRIIPAAEWREMEAGLRQRVTAMKRFPICMATRTRMVRAPNASSRLT